MIIYLDSEFRVERAVRDLGKGEYEPVNGVLPTITEAREKNYTIVDAWGFEMTEHQISPLLEQERLYRNHQEADTRMRELAMPMMKHMLIRGYFGITEPVDIHPLARIVMMLKRTHTAYEEYDNFMKAVKLDAHIIFYEDTKMNSGMFGKYQQSWGYLFIEGQYVKFLAAYEEEKGEPLWRFVLTLYDETHKYNSTNHTRFQEAQEALRPWATARRLMLVVDNTQQEQQKRKRL